MAAAESVRLSMPTRPAAIVPAAANQAREPAASTTSVRSSEPEPLNPTCPVVP